MRRALLAVMTLCGAAGCIDLDVQSEIQDLRILAVQLDPPEVLFSPFLTLPAAQRPDMPVRPPGFPPAQFDVQARVLAAEPRTYAPVSFTSYVCPADDNELCHGYQVPADLGDEHDPAALRASLAPLVQRRTTAINPGDVFGTRDKALEALRFDERAIEYLTMHDPVSGAVFIGLESRARLYLSAESQGIAETAFRRIPFNVDLSLLGMGMPPEVQDQLFEAFGFELCEQPTPQEVVCNDPCWPEDMGVPCDQRVRQLADPADTCMRYPRIANRNPTILHLRYSEGDAPEYDDQNVDTCAVGNRLFPGDSIKLKPGETVKVWPVLARGDSEPYQNIVIDIAAQKLVLSNYQEDLAVAWYATQGVPQPEVSNFILGGDLSTSYTLPAYDTPDRVLLYAIVHDQRGGVDWATIEIERD